MDELQEQVSKTIATARLLQRGDRVLVGVSGGPDSVALLSLLAGLEKELAVHLVVVHVDHQLRPDSASDAEFVGAFAQRLGLPVTILTRHVFAETGQGSLSLEDRARRVRYDAFREAARRHTANRVALAHTADDQAETVMMRMIRGAGVTGLCAIPMSRSLEAPASSDDEALSRHDVTVIRPLLHVWRRDVLAYLARHRLSSRQDATNADPQFLRNRIRLELLPLLEDAYNPRIKALLHQLAEQCQVDAQFLNEAAQRYWKRLIEAQDEAWAIRIDGFLKRPLAIQRQLVRLVIQRLQGDVRGFEFRHWLEIERLFTQRPIGTQVDLPGRVQFERQEHRVLARLQRQAVVF